MKSKAFVNVIGAGVVIFTFFADAALAAFRPSPAWHVEFKNTTLELPMYTVGQIEMTLSNVDISNPDQRFQLRSQKSHLAHVTNDVILITDIEKSTRSWHGNISIAADFLGVTNITVELYDPHTNTTETNDDALQLIIVPPKRFIDHAFVGSVILLMSLLYINFGAALDVTVLRSLITVPVGPTIGFLTQFLIMPLLSYCLGVLVFPDSPEMQLGLFFTGVSPSGGASNTWTVVLGGNINLSVLMTTLSNLSAFVMMPLWIFTLGKIIFDRGNIAVPYVRIGGMAAGMIAPILIGLVIQRCYPRLTRVLVRLLKPISMCLILFIVIFAIITYYYIFELFSWQIVVVGLALPWLGYMLAWLVAKMLRQNNADSLTIAIETGIQNTGVAIFLLGALDQPQSGLTTVVPVSVAIMTPLPLLCLYVYKRCAPIKDGVVLIDK